MTLPVTSDRNLPDEALDRVFHALSDRTRRALVARLLEGPASVKELAEPFPVTLPAIGKHLRVLEAAGLMRREIRGRTHICSLTPEALSDAASWLQTYRVFWEGSLASLASEAERKEGD
jgi:DNA-binding transcriptional ArsR family regulator